MSRGDVTVLEEHEDAFLQLWRKVPDDCRQLLLTALPQVVAVMNAGTKHKKPGEWRYQDPQTHLAHAEGHGEEADAGGARMLRDPFTGEYQRAHQALRVLMALGKELGL